jgi:hypothetical protein
MECSLSQSGEELSPAATVAGQHRSRDTYQRASGVDTALADRQRA